VVRPVEQVHVLDADANRIQSEIAGTQELVHRPDPLIRSPLRFDCVR
jgi:hypothetical protein